jgi:hypothetical protein
LERLASNKQKDRFQKVYMDCKKIEKDRGFNLTKKRTDCNRGERNSCFQRYLAVGGTHLELTQRGAAVEKANNPAGKPAGRPIERIFAAFS